MVISTVSTPDESVDPFRFVMTPLAAGGLNVGTGMERAASYIAVQSKSMPMTRNRSGTTGPWPQSPLLLNFNLSDDAPKAGEAPVHSNYSTPQMAAQPTTGGESSKVNDEPQETALQGLGLGINCPVSDVPERRSASEGAKGFAPMTTDLLRQASRYAPDSSSPHLSINMSSPHADVEAEKLHRNRSKSKEALLTRGSRQDQAGPSPVLPNDCRSPRTVSGKEVGSSGAGGLSAVLVDGSMPPSSVTVHRAQVGPTTHEKGLANSKSIASSISAFVYNATPAPTTTGEQHLDLPNKGKTGSIGWRRTSKLRGRDSVLGLGMRANDSADVKFVNIDLDDGGLETEVTIDSGEASNSRESAKTGQWVSKLWNAVSSPRQTSFNFSDKGDRSLDLEQQPAAKGDRTISRGSFRPLSLVEKRQSSGRYNLDLQRQRFRSPMPGEEDEIAEKDARAVALRLLAGSPRLPPPTEGVELEMQPEQNADLSAEEREKERIDALKKLRRMSAVERQRKRSSGIGYITSSTPVVEASRLPYVNDSEQGRLERNGSIKTNNKRVSVTLFGGKERYSVLSPLAANEPELAGGPERAWLDSMRSPRIADSPSGFTPRMAFEPHDWGAAQQEQDYAPRQPLSSSTANHIPLLLSSGGPAAQRSAVGPISANDHGMTVSELDQARDEMRRLAGQGKAHSNDEEEEAYETYHTPMPDAPDSWSYADQHHYPPATVEYEPATTTALGDFGISPEKDTTTRLHRRTNTRTARFAVDEPHHEDAEDDHPAVSIFTRQKHRRQHSFSNVQHSPLTRRSRRHGGPGGGHGLFATPAALLDSNTPSKNMFWAGFLGMPWLWMIGGWYLTPDGQLRHPSADGKVDVWQHEPSMQQSSGSIPGSSSTFTEGWMQGGESGLGLGLSGIPPAMSYTPSSTGTSNSTQTTSSDPNRPPPSKTRKSKTKSLGALLDSNPQISFYQSPMRVLQEPAPAFGGVWRHPPMEPLPELEEPPRRHTSAIGGVQLALETKTSLNSPWRDLERYVLLNRLAAILSGVLVFAGFTTAIWAVVTNF